MTALHTADLLDRGFKRYRADLRIYLSAVATPFILLLLPGILYLVSPNADPRRQLAVIAFGLAAQLFVAPAAHATILLFYAQLRDEALDLAAP
jgi:hypothetical protein